MAQKVNVPNGVAGLDSSGRVTAALVGDTSAAPALSSLPGATNAMTAGLRAAIQPSVGDYMQAGAQPGVGIVFDVLAPQTQGDTTVLLHAVATGLEAGRLVTSPYLPAGTLITSSVPIGQVRVACTTTMPTHPVAVEQMLIPYMDGMSNKISCDGIIGIPAGQILYDDTHGTQVGTIQSSSFDANHTHLWLESDVQTDIPVGATFVSVFGETRVSLSQGWTQNVTPANGPVGVTSQDDGAAFGGALQAVKRSGTTGSVSIPNGYYYRKDYIYAPAGTGYTWQSGLGLLPGSAGDDTTPSNWYVNSGFAQSYSLKDNTTSGGVLALYDNLTVPKQNTSQGSALYIKQINLSRSNDGTSWGPGMVGAEVQQSLSYPLRGAMMWAYHATDDADPGQMISWAGAELELHNNSGFWGAFPGNPLFGNKTGLHIDDNAFKVTAVPNSVALLPGGAWHTGVECDTNILDWCVLQTDGFHSDAMPMPMAGIDAQGRLLGKSVAVSQPAPDTYKSYGVVGPANHVAAINNDGSVGAAAVNTPSIGYETSGVAGITIEDGGRFNAPVTISIGAPPAGGQQATASVSSYTLRAVQGAIALNATQNSNAPDGVTQGMVFSLPGGQCQVQPQVTYDGTEFLVTTPGTCSTLPPASVPPGLQRASITLTYLSGGTGAAPATLPTIEPLYGIAGVAITSPGAGYNSMVAPDVLVITKFDATAGTWIGLRYTPARLVAKLGASPSKGVVAVTSAFQPQMMTVASLPTPCGTGQVFFASDARNTGEAAGAGTGSLTYCTAGHKWYANGAPISN